MLEPGLPAACTLGRQVGTPNCVKRWAKLIECGRVVRCAERSAEASGEGERHAGSDAVRRGGMEVGVVVKAPRDWVGQPLERRAQELRVARPVASMRREPRVGVERRTNCA